MDYGRVAASLRRKAAANGVTPDEAAALLRKAQQLDRKYNALSIEATKLGADADPPDPIYGETDIVEDGYRWQPDDY